MFFSATESPAYRFQATVTHDYGYASTACENEYNAAVQNNLNTFQSNIYALCNVSWAVQVVSAGHGMGSTEVSCCQNGVFLAHTLLNIIMYHSQILIVLTSSIPVVSVHFCIGISYAKLFEAAKIHVQIMRF